ncbi:MAG: cytochrome c-type biogenesis protein CcmH [Acidobacteria bacterium]|nr:cytochrome c-type biogenesis protein CcmH [Acidobacteriota bacterium]
MQPSRRSGCLPLAVVRLFHRPGPEVAGGLVFLALCLSLSVGSLPAAAPGKPVTKEQVQEITSNLVCLCGCGNKTVSVCGCGVADATIREVETMLSQGKTVDEIFAHYVNASGLVALASPPKKGFNLIAWILPFAGILIGGVFLIGKIRNWQSDLDRREAVLRKASAAPASPAAEDPYKQRLNSELGKID